MEREETHNDRCRCLYALVKLKTEKDLNCFICCKDQDVFDWCRNFMLREVITDAELNGVSRLEFIASYDKVIVKNLELGGKITDLVGSDKLRGQRAKFSVTDYFGHPLELVVNIPNIDPLL